MNILMVNKFLYPKTGVETYFLKIGNYLKKQGHEVEYFGMNDDKNIVGNNWNVYIRNIDSINKAIKKIIAPLKVIYNFETKIKIKKIIKKFKPDIIHLNNIDFELMSLIIDVADKMKIPIVQTIHDYKMIGEGNLTTKQIETFKKVHMYICPSKFLEKKIIRK